MSTPVIDPNITMSDLLLRLPGAQRALFRKYHIGGCSSCGFSPQETLAGVCARNENLPVEEVIAYLHEAHEEEQRLLIDPPALAAALAETKEPVRLIDIRTREEFEAARIEAATLFTQEMMQEALSRWDRSALLVIVDHLGKRSLDAATFFAGHGFTNVKALRGGVDAWSEQVDPEVPRYELE
ncbi:MAG TPA: rhodanese-like domain-containing protein [Chthoniobacteraceae bacterium]|nr:rhodanese-like domain-containing protein [Chthoniobacteraceae bacterium]